MYLRLLPLTVLLFNAMPLTRILFGPMSSVLKISGANHLKDSFMLKVMSATSVHGFSVLRELCSRANLALQVVMVLLLCVF